MSGADGALSLNGTTAFIDAGDIKRYSSISIINSGELIIRGWSYYGTSNPGHLPTLIGCRGNCTINTAGKIYVTDNAGDPVNYFEDANYSAATIPFDCVVSPITYTRFGGFGGAGGETGGWGTWGGFDGGVVVTGHGGGGSGLYNGGDVEISYDWGASGYGSDGSAGAGAASTVVPEFDGFGASGFIGTGGEVASGIGVAGGGSGGLRGLSGGALYLQIGGTANIDSGTIVCDGSPGGNGGDGGAAYSPDDAAYGGGPGGGGAGGGGGYCWIRYKTGTVSLTAVSANGGAGGLTGAVGSGGAGPFPSDGFPAQDGTSGVAGGSDIATY